MHIKKITLKQFRNIEGTLEVPFHGKQVIVLGANGLGKSNIPLAVGFVLNSDPTFLNVENELDFINEAHKVEKLDEAQCSVEIFLESERVGDAVHERGKTLLRTLDAQSRSSYKIDGTYYTKQQYDEALLALNLRASAVIIPQKALRDFKPDTKYGYGKSIQALCEDWSNQKFGSEDEKLLVAKKASASKLERRRATLKNMIYRLGRLQPRPSPATPNLEVQVAVYERSLILAGLWKTEERWKKGVLYLKELRDVLPVLESQRKSVNEEIQVTQNEILELNGKLHDFEQQEARRESLEENAMSKRTVLQRLESSRGRVHGIINKVRDSTRGTPGSKTEAIDRMLRELELLEVSSTLGAWIHDELEKINERFEQEHPDEMESLKLLEEADRTGNSNRRNLQIELRKKKHERFAAQERRRLTQESIDTLEIRRSAIEAKITTYRSFLTNNARIVQGMEAMVERKGARLATLQRCRRAMLRKPRRQKDFELRCLIEGVDEYFADELPTQAVYGLLRDLIEPEEEAHRITIERALDERLDSIVVKDRAVQRRMRGLMRGDAQYKVPKTGTLALAIAGKAPTGLTRRKHGLPLVSTFGRVSERYRGDTRAANRIMRLYQELTKNILFCRDSLQAMNLIKKCRGTKQQADGPVKALSADGILCSTSGAVKFFPQPSEAELPFPDGLRRMEDITREMRDLELFLKKKPGVALVLYKCLQYVLECSLTKLEHDLRFVNEELRAVAASLSDLDADICKCDENCRVLEDELTEYRIGSVAVARQEERLRINVIRMGYVRELIESKGFSEAELAIAMEQDQMRIIFEQDYVLSELIDTFEKEMTERWRSRLNDSLQKSGQDFMARTAQEHENAESAFEAAKRSLNDYRNHIQEKLSEKNKLIELRETFDARLDELFNIAGELNQEAATNAINQQRQILSLRKLQRRRKALLSKLDIGSAKSHDEDTDLGEEIDVEKLLESYPSLDYTSIPESARASDDAMDHFIGSTRDKLKALRSEKLDQIMRTRNAGQTDVPNMEKRMEEITAILETCEKDLKSARAAIQKIEDDRRKSHEFLDGLFPKVLHEIPRIFEELSGLGIHLVERKLPGQFRDYGSEVTFRWSRHHSERHGPACLTAGAKAFLWLSIVLAIQKINKVHFLILDEIDARIDEQSSLSLNRAISRYATSEQVICITHKPESILDVGVQLLGITRCPVSGEPIVLSLNPSADHTEDYDDSACHFTGRLTADELDYIFTGAGLEKHINEFMDL